MIKRRIHTLKAVIKSSTEPYQDDEGNMIFPEEGKDEVVEIECRAESNTVDGRSVVRDGVNYDYSYLVFASGDMTALPYSTKVEINVIATNEIFGMGEVVKFERGQRVTRIWLK